MRTAHLNVFQRLARSWDAVHPYNAAQACRVGGTFSEDEIRNGWHAAVSGIAPAPHEYPQEPARGREAGPGWPVRFLGVDDDLSRYFTAELNHPFPEQLAGPVRPFAQQLVGSLWLGVVYQHWVADSVSVRALLRAWLNRLHRVPAGPADRLHLVPCRTRDILARWQSAWLVAPTFANLARRYGEHQAVRKVHTYGPLDYPVRVRLSRSGPGVLPPLLERARGLGVSLNDVFLAALAQAAYPLIPAQKRPGRDDIALSSIVDLRPGLDRTLAGGFGCLLGFTTTVCRGRDVTRWGSLLRSVASQSRAQRRAGIGPASAVWMLAAEAASRFVPPEQLYDFFRKAIPLTAGLSNVNLNDTWVAAGAAQTRVLEYVRVSPTGPVVPVALAVTSLGSELQLALTYRSALLNDWTAMELMQTFINRLARVAAAH